MILTIPETTIKWVKEGEDYILDTNLLKGLITFSWLSDCWVGILSTPRRSFRTESDTAEKAAETLQKIIPDLVDKRTKSLSTLDIHIQS